MTEPRPIFVGGLSRSGKTPVRMALGAHPRISMTRKTYLWRRYHHRYGDLNNPRCLRRLLDALARDEDLARLEPDLSRVEAELRFGPVTYPAVFGLLHAHYAERVGKPRWGEQLGLVEQFADEIFATWPQARMVHLVRDPRSLLAAGGRPGKLGWDTARWEWSVGLAERNLHHYPNAYLVLKYEQLVDDPEATLRRLCRFLSEDYLPDMLAVLDGSAPIRPGRVDEEAIDSTSVQSFIETHTRRHLEHLGYPARRRRRRLHPRPLDCLGRTAGRISGWMKSEAR